jgi:PhoH-like ATPase
MDRDDHPANVAPTFLDNVNLGSSQHVLRSPSARKRKSASSHRHSATPVGTKTFILDTNVLLHDPACIHRFAEHHVCIPVDVLSELDRFKNEMTERGANAREVHRALMKTFSR